MFNVARSNGRAAMQAIIGLALVGAIGMASAAAMGQAETTRELRQATERPAVQKQRDAEAAATLRGRRVAVLVGEGFQDAEALMPIAYLVNRGATVTVVGIEPDILTAYNSDMTIRVERSVDDVSFRQFDALVIPGGRGPSGLRENENVVNFARDFFNSGKTVAAICHGPQVLITAGVLEGKKATCYMDVASELQEAGAQYDDKPVVVDENLITSRVPDDIPVFCKKIEEMLVEAHDQRRQRTPERPTRPEPPRRPSR